MGAYTHLPRPVHVVQERAQVEAVVVGRVALRVVRRRERGHLVPVDGVVGEESLHLVRHLRRCKGG